MSIEYMKLSQIAQTMTIWCAKLYMRKWRFKGQIVLKVVTLLSFSSLVPHLVCFHPFSSSQISIAVRKKKTQVVF